MANLGNEIDRVLVGEDARRPEDPARILRDVEADYVANNNRKNQVQARLAEIMGRIRSFGGKRIEQVTYNRLSDEQVELKNELVQLEKRAADLKSTRKELNEHISAQDRNTRSETFELLKQVAADQKQILRILKSNPSFVGQE